MQETIRYVCTNKNCRIVWALSPVYSEFKGDARALRNWEREHRCKWSHCHCGTPFPKDREKLKKREKDETIQEMS